MLYVLLCSFESANIMFFPNRRILINDAQDTNDWGTPDPAAIAARLNGYYYAPKTRMSVSLCSSIIFPDGFVI